MEPTGQGAKRGAAKGGEDDAPHIELARSTEREYCEYARATRHNELWWYFNGLAPRRGYSRPFPDHRGRWWFCVKPGFAWPVNFFDPLDYVAWRPNLSLLLGCQAPVRDGANSRVWMNVIQDLRGYDVSRVQSNKRRAVRKGVRELDLVRLDPANAQVSGAARDVWNSHVARTGWNRTMEPAEFAGSWRELADWPGTTVIGAMSRGEAPVLCAWTILRCVDDVVYVDTLASHTDRLAARPNDAVVFAALCSAERAGITRAHYSLCSSIESLEAFKRSLGFVAHPFPARLSLRFPVELALRLLRPNILKRLRGDADWAATPSPAESPADGA